ncbi:peptidoglycan-binding protein [Actinomadura nitritigenes]|uniref:Peptidoglycan-binding protein n=1 Tax=Actinomadura nitritigenes TaxID=134602 RepID=A0ABS3R368_9ACTN|nr:peptidoglycan-binding protein [Actinomadura nitritigenes]MBO2440699.1 peptidoglycan-binding protein [Actinomadura nitritigenes]
MSRRRTAVLGAAGVVVVGGAGLAAAGLGGGDGPSARHGALPPATAAVERTTLVETQKVDGTLGYGTSASVSAQGRGTLTWLAGEGAVVTRGRPVYRADNEPVPLLYGKLPLYRTLDEGTEGADVLQFEKNLAALGYTGFTVDKTYGSATAAAVKRWQDDLGVDETGKVAPGSVVIAPGRIRVADHKAQVGDKLGGPVLTYTGTTRVVGVDLDVQYQRLARKGAKVEIALPDDRTAQGTIASVGKVAEQGHGDDPTTVHLTISVTGRHALGTYDKAPVGVNLVAGRHPGVLAVPVAALLAQGDGGYAVQVVQNGTVRTVPVETGVFAGGKVEVSGSGLAEGMKVGVPS